MGKSSRATLTDYLDGNWATATGGALHHLVQHYLSSIGVMI